MRIALACRGARQLAAHELAHDVVSGRVPCGRVGGNRRASAPHLVGQPCVEHVVDARRDAIGAARARIHHKIARAPTGRARTLACSSLTAPTRQQRDLDRREAAACDRGARAPDRASAPSAAARRRRARRARAASAARRAGSSGGSSNRPSNSARRYKSGSADDERRRARCVARRRSIRRQRRPRAPRSSARSDRATSMPRCGTRARSLARRLRGTDVEAAIDLPRVGADDRRSAARSASHMRDARLARRRRAADRRERRRARQPAKAPLDLVPGELHDRRATVHVVRGQRRVARAR